MPTNSKIADLNEETLWDLKQMAFGDNLELLLISALEMRTNYDAHAHSAVDTVSTNSLSATSAVDGFGDGTGLAGRERIRTRLTGLGVDGAFIDVWEKTVDLAVQNKAAYNVHEHASTAGLPSTTVPLTDLPPIPTPYQIEQWNRAYEPFFNAKIGTMLSETRAIVTGLAAFMTTHTHSLITDVSVQLLGGLTMTNTLN